MHVFQCSRSDGWAYIHRYQHTCSHKDVVINGFHKAGIEMPSDNSGGDNADPFADLD